MIKQLLVLTGATILALAATAQDSTHVPLDTITIGGPASETVYSEISETLLPITLEEFVPTDVNDSAFVFPSHEQYGTWNTQVIFPALPKKKALDSLVLAYDACDHAHPICGAKTSGYGYRRGRFHHGLDIDLNTGDLVQSLFAGKVRVSHYSRSFGNVVVVRHNNGLETLYAHLSHRMVEPGDEIEAGTVIGLGGNTGRSSGSHLHLEVRYLGKSIDPELIIDVKEGELKATTLHLDDKLKARLAKEPAAATHYKVRKGDSLYRIARNNGTSVNNLCKLNGISSRATLRVGKVLRIK